MHDSPLLSDELRLPLLRLCFTRVQLDRKHVRVLHPSRLLRKHHFNLRNPNHCKLLKDPRPTQRATPLW